MPRFHILKELKKALKRKRRHVWSLGAGVFLFLLATLVGSWFAHRLIIQGESERQAFPADASISVWMDNPATQEGSGLSIRDQIILMLQKMEGPVELVLHRTYLCGEESRQIGSHPTSVAIELLKSHRDWGAEFDSTGALIMEETVDDLSPQCRKTAYIAMDKDGNLSLFDGLPRREKVIRTFFQLDVDMLETRMSEDRMLELSNGIRITDRDEYNSVLSTFNEFAKLKSE
ncbi:BofC C-terminal domain-containing protein [Cohnella sp.]|uniref:BofC C-terminal domain-containing protein n=1 Tax=Cohnella sp. TaxID=1883426 RepID=UPI00356A8F27